MNIEALAREAGAFRLAQVTRSESGETHHAPAWVFTEDSGALTRFAELIRAQADADATERLSIIADELIAGLGEPGRGLAEMLREGIVALESYAASVVWDVRRQALEDAASLCEANHELIAASLDGFDIAVLVRALKDKP